MFRYPIQLDLQDKRCVVVGAGKVASRKVAALCACGGAVWVVAPEVTEMLAQQAAEGTVRWVREAYQAAHLDGAFLAIAATERPEVNVAVLRDAAERGVLACATDDSPGGNFVAPAAFTRGDFQITVSTGGQSPTLASVLREGLETQFGPEWAAMTHLLGALRPDVQAVGDAIARRQAVQSVLADLAVWEALRGGEYTEAEARARQCLSLSLE
jgi:precorrin-2 dehydrogenase/sirohydrochlorin ferrochelatase